MKTQAMQPMTVQMYRNDRTLTSVVATIVAICLLLVSFYNGPSGDLILLNFAWSLIAGFLVITCCRKNAHLLTVPTDRISLLFMLYIVFVYFHGVFSIAPNNSNIVRWAYLLGPALFLLWRSFGNQHAWRTLWPCLFAIGVFSALIGIFEFWQQPDLNVSGQREDANGFAELLLAVLTPATMIYLGSDLNTLTRRVYELGMVLMALALFLSDSRAGLLIWLVSALLLITYLAVNQKLQLKRLAAVMAVFTIAWILFLQLPATIESYAGLFNPDNDAVNIRMLMWKSSWEMYLQHPFWGSGLGTFGMYYEAFRSPQEYITSGMNPHNDYLQTLIEGGPLLLLFIVSFGLITLYKFSLLLFRKNQSQIEFTTIRYSLLVVILGLLAHAMINFTITTLVLSMVACLYLAIATNTDNSRTRQPLKNMQPKAAAVLLLIAIALPISTLWLDTIIDNIYNPGSRSHRAMALIDQQDSHAMYRAANIFSVLRPNNIFPKNYQLQQLTAAFNSSNDPLRQKQLGAIIVNQYETMKKTCRPCDFVYRDLGNHYRQLGKNELANEQYLAAIAIAPTRVKNYLDYADFLAKNGQYAEAMTMLLVDTKPRMPIIIKKSGINTEKLILQHALNLAKQFGTSTDINHLNGRLNVIKGQNIAE